MMLQIITLHPANNAERYKDAPEKWAQTMMAIEARFIISIQVHQWGKVTGLRINYNAGGYVQWVFTVENIVFNHPITNTIDITGGLKTVVGNEERQIICNVLSDCNYNKTIAAKKLNIDRKTLYNKMKMYGINKKKNYA